jgi:hypothetical protein
MAVHAEPIPPQSAAVSGLVTAGAAAAVIADTGGLPAGDYLIEIELAGTGTVAAGKGIVVEHRDAANTGNVNRLGGCGASESRSIGVSRLKVAANERVRAVVGAVAFAASETALASIRAHKLD